jgi:hypothetical protein
MDDMTAFERQVADEMHRIVGPARPVDDLAILDAITTTPSPTWRLQTMFSAAKLVVATAIVALFGSFLLAGGSMPQPPDLLPGVALVTEEVEPGVFRVLNDGTDNDLDPAALLGGSGTVQVVAGQDGSVWIRDAQPGDDWLFQPGEDRLFRLGTGRAADATRLHDHWPDLSIAPDGTLWALGDSARNDDIGTGAQLFSLSGGEWTPHDVPKGATLTGIETPVDGSVWASWSVGPDTGPRCPNGGDGGGRLAVGQLLDGEWVEEAIEPETLVGDGGSLAIGPDGTALLGTTYFNSCHEGSWIGIAERGEDGWIPSLTAEPAGDPVVPGIGLIAIGSDGTAWAYQDLSIHDDTADPIWNPRLLRRTGGDWEVLGEDESVPALIGTQTWGSRMTASPDGRLWIALDGPWALDWHRDWGKKSIAATLDGPCAGVLSYDGATWTHHLAGACAADISAAPNGAVWVTVADLDPDWIDEAFQDDPERALRLREAVSTAPPAGVYVITPVAVEAAGPLIVAP